MSILSIKTMRKHLIGVMLGLLIAVPVMPVNLDFGKLKDTFSKVKQATGTVSEEDEIKIGGLIVSTLLGAAPLVQNPQLQQYVNQVGRWVALQTERPDLPWVFSVIDSENVNAFAAPGGYIVLTKGLFMALNSEAELAGVLGHEIAHVLQHHHLDALKKNARLDLLGDALVASTDDRKKRKKLDKVVSAGTALYARGLDREDEYEADRVGAVLLARAGYDPYAFLDVLTTLDSLNPNDKHMALLLKTHPPFSERLGQMDKVMEGRLDSYAMAPRRTESLLAVQKVLLIGE